jgi:hypothetical protein
MRNITLKDFLTDREILRAMELKTAKEICEHVIKPSIERINRTLGQKNDPMYLAYAVEYAITQARKGK